MQAAPQASYPAGQRQLPPTHPWVGPHTLEHAPQLVGSEAVFTHEVPQLVLPAAHVQVPDTHPWDAPHALPHAPQLAGSAETLTH